MLKRLASVAVIAATGVGLFGAVSAEQSAQAQELTKVKILMPVTRIDEAYAPFLVAKEVGYYKEEGLDVEIIPAAGAKNALIQVAAGNADIATISPTDLAVGQQPPHNMPVQLFYNVYYKNIWSISVLPDSPVKNLEGLKGKKLGVASMGSSGVTYGTAYLARAGLKIGQDAQFLPVGVGGQGAAALRSGAVDAVVYWDAMVTKLAVSGVDLRELAVDEKIRNLPDICLGAHTDTIANKPEMIAGVGRAVAKGYVFNQANPEAAVRITWKQIPESKQANVPEERALKDAIEVNQSRMQIWSSPKTEGKFGKFVREDHENLIEFAREQDLLKPDAKVDLDKLYTEKFIDEFNKFNISAIQEQAKAFDIESLKN